MRWAACVVLALVMLSLLPVRLQADLPHCIASDLPDERRICVRDPSYLPRAPIPYVPHPTTVENLDAISLIDRQVMLDEAILQALRNGEVVRVLTGVSAGSSGRTIYDTAISQTNVDQQKARFDPAVTVLNQWSRQEPPLAILDPLDPTRALITGVRSDLYDVNFGLSRTNQLGGRIDFGTAATRLRRQPGVFPLNPQTSGSLDLSYTQPLLQGAGIGPNRAPIVIARIDAERSYFQYKGSVQELVRGVIEAYWLLVFARTDLWAREQQVEQAQFALDQANARLESQLISVGQQSQARLALANFRAALISARANVLDREQALHNLLGLPPSATERLVPITIPLSQPLEVPWEEVLTLAEQRRPDIIELKLILEADQQTLLQARNQARPQLDAVGLYRWNGLTGTMPNGQHNGSAWDEGTDWTLGINFSVPLGLRQSRAIVRQRELLIMRDRANLQQGLHRAVHTLALVVRNMAQVYAQYEAFGETREAALKNLEQQLQAFRVGNVEFINVLQAIADWGNAVSSEAQSLTQYNTLLATLEAETGTILESHGIRFFEERYRAASPLSLCGRHKICYPKSTPASENADQYRNGDEPSEEFFELDSPLRDLKERDDRLRLEPLPPLDTKDASDVLKPLPPIEPR